MTECTPHCVQEIDAKLFIFPHSVQGCGGGAPGRRSHRGRRVQDGAARLHQLPHHLHARAQGRHMMTLREDKSMYRVLHQHADLGWVGLNIIWDFPPSYSVAQPFLPKFHLPKQNQADCGTAKIKANPTEVGELMEHPVNRMVLSSSMQRIQQS